MIDEASQIRPEDALGVIARARQIVVVGDQKQLPPTSFFDRLVDDVEENDEDEEAPVGATAADMESILSLCEARGLRHPRARRQSRQRAFNARDTHQASARSHRHRSPDAQDARLCAGRPDSPVQCRAA